MILPPSGLATRYLGFGWHCPQYFPLEPRLSFTCRPRPVWGGNCTNLLSEFVQPYSELKKIELLEVEGVRASCDPQMATPMIPVLCRGRLNVFPHFNTHDGLSHLHTIHFPVEMRHEAYKPSSVSQK